MENQQVEGVYERKNQKKNGKEESFMLKRIESENETRCDILKFKKKTKSMCKVESRIHGYKEIKRKKKRKSRMSKLGKKVKGLM